ncbi:DUF3108 domain-containing protein [Comamonas sp. GB3 AK4-5]|uniref:DUF3108 domain-containing protein n=1 Tax=Comamonas sp. GB3 AK4-5 TaxID=3231487 RepID=UPI00351DB8DB
MRRLLALSALTVAVLALHAWLLTELPWGSHTDAPASTASEAPVFATRTVVPPPPPPPPAPPPAPKPKPRPAPPPPPPPLPTPEPAADPVPDASEAAETAAEPVEPVEPPVSDAAAEPTEAAAQAAATDSSATPTPEAEPPAAGMPADDAEAEAAQANAPAAGTPPPQRITLRTAAGQPAQTDMPYQAPPAQLLRFQVQGQVKGFHYSASARLQWQPQLQQYQASQEISAFLLGARSQNSRGQITAEGLQPERFEDRARSKLRAAHMDWVTGLARFEPEAPLARIATGTQDRLSVFLQLAGMLAAAPQRYPQGAEITLPTASTKAVEPWTFLVQDSGTEELPVGSLPTLRLERLPRHPGDQKAELWLSPALGYLPVRIRLSEDNGDHVDMRLQSHSAP